MIQRSTITDSKSDFYKEFPYVIPPIYRKLADELLVELHLLSHQENFKITPVFSVGLRELFYVFTNGYKPNDHITLLFNAICNCNGFEPDEINSKAEELVAILKSIRLKDLSDNIHLIDDNKIDDNYYSRINAIGLYKLISDLPDCDSSEIKALDSETIKLAESIGYPKERVEKDISLYRSNIEKMNQALEIIAQNIKSKKS